MGRPRGKNRMRMSLRNPTARTITHLYTQLDALWKTHARGAIRRYKEPMIPGHARTHCKTHENSLAGERVPASQRFRPIT